MATSSRGQVGITYHGGARHRGEDTRDPRELDRLSYESHMESIAQEVRASKDKPPEPYSIRT